MQHDGPDARNLKVAKGKAIPMEPTPKAPHLATETAFDPWTATPLAFDAHLFDLRRQRTDRRHELRGTEMRAMEPVRSGSATPEVLNGGRPSESEKRDEVILELTERIRALDRIYDDRGRWSRVYATLSPRGHLHRHRYCRTLRPTTVLAWLVGLASASSAEVVALAGWRACGACFPTDDMGDRRRMPSRIDAFADYMVAHHLDEGRSAS